MHWKFNNDIVTPDLVNFPLTPESMEVLQSASSSEDIDDYSDDNIARLFENSNNPIEIVEMSDSEVSSTISDEFLDSVTDISEACNQRPHRDCKKPNYLGDYIE